MIRPPNLNRVPLGEGGLLHFRSAEFGGIGKLDGEQQQSAKDLLVDCADVFSQSDLDLSKCNIIKHAIKITYPQPFKERYRRIPPHLYEEVKNHLQEMVEVGAIRRSFCPWASAVVLVRKKDGGLCSYNKTAKDGYSLPRIEDTLDCLQTLAGFWECNIIKHAIKITYPQPFKERYRRIPPHLYEEVKNHLQEMVEVGAIRRSFCPWASPVVLVRKKRWGAYVLYQPIQT